MNDLIFLTLEPIEGGHCLSWDRVRPFIDGLEDTFGRLAKKVVIPDLEIGGASLIVVGSPVVGSQRWQFKLEVSAEFGPPKGRRLPPKAAETKSLTQQVGVNAMGGIIAGAVLLAFSGPSEDPVYGPEAKLVEECAKDIAKAGRGALDEMRYLAEQSQCRSARLQFQSYPPLELAGEIEPLSLERELKTVPPERVDLFLRSNTAVVVYLNGERRTGYFVTRMDNNSEAIAIFRDPIPKQHLNDRLLTEAKLLKPEDRRRLYISSLSLGGPDAAGIESRLRAVQSVLEIKANYGVMRRRMD